MYARPTLQCLNGVSRDCWQSRERQVYSLRVRYFTSPVVLRPSRTHGNTFVDMRSDGVRALSRAPPGSYCKKIHYANYRVGVVPKSGTGLYGLSLSYSLSLSFSLSFCLCLCLSLVFRQYMEVSCPNRSLFFGNIPRNEGKILVQYNPRVQATLQRNALYLQVSVSFILTCSALLVCLLTSCYRTGSDAIVASSAFPQCC